MVRFDTSMFGFGTGVFVAFEFLDEGKLGVVLLSFVFMEGRLYIWFGL